MGGAGGVSGSEYPPAHKHIAWLRQPHRRRAKLPIPAVGFAELIEKYDPVRIILKSPEREGFDFYVVRVLSAGLIPLNYGIGNEAYGHTRFASLGRGLRWAYPAPPHFFP